MVLKMSKEKIKRIIISLLFNFCIQFVLLSYYNLYISNIIKPIGIIMGAAFIGSMVVVIMFTIFCMFYARFLERVDEYLDKYSDAEDLEEER